ncbi:hypothetical protein [Clostridium tagluense]|uniref:hypothetical protein n=1 Tax=Clostridium tagluense TaxID=360422 RepID=UPI001C6E546F|nr:hypothetical protein [Clostridium tagluense]MBW9157231.1 hypothetical protein [Clostridium tagluense]WLC67169.1 hypothetical protein KTC93_08320 [Clostridium tagluense]
MEKLYNLINTIISLEHICEENDKIFSLCFNYQKELDSVVQYNFLNEIKNTFPKCLNLFISSSATNEIDILDFVDDRQEFEDEICNLKDEKNKYILIFNKDIFIKNTITNLINCNVVFFIEPNKLIDCLSKDISVLENEIIKENKKNVFILGKSTTFFHNDFIMITNINRESLGAELILFNNNSIASKPREIINKRNKLCNWVDGSHFLLPETFYFDFNNSEFTFHNDFNNIIRKKNIDLIVPFISNFTGIIDNKYMSLINGNKRIEIYYDLKPEDYTLEAYKHLYELYKWIYEESTFDKINICRNVISILVTAKCQGSAYKTIIQNSDWLAKSVQDNFTDFLQKNINSFFNEQNTVIKKLTDNIIGINNQVSELTKLTTTNITSLLGTAVAATIGYIAKGDILYIKILFFLYLCFLIINSAFNLPISIIRAMQCRNDFKHNKDMYLKLYPDDSNIEGMKKRNCFNLVVFWLYTFFTVALIAVIIIFIINTDINEFIGKFK